MQVGIIACLSSFLLVSSCQAIKPIRKSASSPSDHNCQVYLDTDPNSLICWTSALLLHLLNQREPGTAIYKYIIYNIQYISSVVTSSQSAGGAGCRQPSPCNLTSRAPMHQCTNAPTHQCTGAPTATPWTHLTTIQGAGTCGQCHDGKPMGMILAFLLTRYLSQPSQPLVV